MAARRACTCARVHSHLRQCVRRRCLRGRTLESPRSPERARTYGAVGVLGPRTTHSARLRADAGLCGRQVHGTLPSIWTCAQRDRGDAPAPRRVGTARQCDARGWSGRARSCTYYVVHRLERLMRLRGMDFCFLSVLSLKLSTLTDHTRTRALTGHSPASGAGALGWQA